MGDRNDDIRPTVSVYSLNTLQSFLAYIKYRRFKGPLCLRLLGDPEDEATTVPGTSAPIYCFTRSDITEQWNHEWQNS